MNFLTEEVGEISAALAKFQAEVKPIPKAAENPHFKSRYADHATIFKHIQPTLKACGLSVLQTVEFAENLVPYQVRTTVLHSGGQGFESFVPYVVPDRGSGPQAHGSALTYARRYGLCCALGISAGDDDDDGNAGQDSTTSENRPQPQGRRKASGQPGGDWIKMAAKFDSKAPCDLCGNTPQKGEEIAYKKGSPARHWACHEIDQRADQQAHDQSDEGTPATAATMPAHGKANHDDDPLPF